MAGEAKVSRSQVVLGTMNIHTYPLGQLQANCYLLEDEGKALLIDPGDSADFILEQLLVKKLELVGIIATHGHFDHIMAVGEIQLSYPHVPLHIHSADTFLLQRVVETARHFLEYDPVVMPVRLTAGLTAGSFSIDQFSFNVQETPGHTPGSCSIYFKENNVLFSGDTLFHHGIGRYDFSYSDRTALRTSLEQLLALPAETMVYSGHGEETTIEEEQEIISQFF